MSPQSIATQTINTLVEKDPQVLRVLGRYGIDTCCGGARTIEQAAKEGGLDLAKLVAELEALFGQKPN